MLDVTRESSDPGLAALVMLMQFKGVAAEPAQIAHRFGRVPIGVTEMLRCAKDFRLKARVVRTRWTRLAGSPVPAIGCRRDGGFRVVGQASAGPALVSGASRAEPQGLIRPAFEACLHGRLPLIS